jgi:hypothetical protein
MAAKDTTRPGAFEIRPSTIAIVLTKPKSERAAAVEAMVALRKGK